MKIETRSRSKWSNNVWTEWEEVKPPRENTPKYWFNRLPDTYEVGPYKVVRTSDTEFQATGELTGAQFEYRLIA